MCPATISKEIHKGEIDVGKLTESIVKKRPQKAAGTFRQLNLFVFTVVSLGLIISGAYYFMFPRKKEFAINYYTFAQVSQQDFAVNVTASGVVIPKMQTTLRVPANGVITTLEITEGEDVEEGALLAQIASPELEEQRLSAERKLEQANQELEKLVFDQLTEREKLERDIDAADRSLVEAQEDYQLKELSYSYGAISRKELERAVQTMSDAEYTLSKTIRQLEETLKRQEIALKRAQETVESEKRNMAETLKSIDGLTVRAPFAGRVIELNAAKDNEIIGNAQLMTIADMDSPIVRVQLDADVIDLVGLQHKALITTPLGTYDGYISYISAKATEVSGTPVVETHIQFANHVNELRPNSTVSVEIEVGRRHNSPYLPRGAYLASGQQLFVYVIEGDTAVRRDVRYGMITSNAVEILSGLEPDETVILSSYDEFRHLKEIRINPQGGQKQ